MDRGAVPTDVYTKVKVTYLVFEFPASSDDVYPVVRGDMDPTATATSVFVPAEVFTSRVYSVPRNDSRVIWFFFYLSFFPVVLRGVPEGPKCDPVCRRLCASVRG